MIHLKSSLTLPAAGLSGFEPPLTDIETAVQASVHRFAKDVLRPLGTQLDKMDAEAVVAPGSPFFSVFAELAKLGLDPSFDNVKVPKRFAIALQDDYYGNLASVWSYAGTHMSQVFTGVARAAFELALQYCHERRQGGRALIDHQLTRYRLGDMLRRVETARAVARRSLSYARLSPLTHPYVTASAKVTVTEEAVRVAEEAFRLFGGAGTSREYPIEKLVRDARSALIEDGENRILTMRLGLLAQQLYAEGWSQN
jgi:hypothetical protein